MEVSDLAAGKPLYTMTGFKDEQAALYVPKSNLIFLSDGELGLCNVYEGTTYKLVRSVDDVPDADNIRYDAFSARTYDAALVHLAYRHGLRALDSRDGKPVFDIPLDAQSESFQFEVGTGRIFANLPTLGYVAVANSGKRVVVDKWLLPRFKPFYPIGTGCSEPSTLHRQPEPGQIGGSRHGVGQNRYQRGGSWAHRRSLV